MLGFGRGRRGPEPRTAPPVIVPADAIRPGEDDGALIRAVVHYVRTMRGAGPYAWGELDPDAVAAYAVDGYLSRVARGGHAAYLAELPAPALLARCREGLERVAPGLARLHGTLLDAGPDGSETELAALDEGFRESGGRGAVDPVLAGLVAGIAGLEVIPPGSYPARLAEVAAGHPEAEARHRDLRIAGFHADLTSPVHAGLAVILSRTTGRCAPFTLRPCRPDAGQDAEPDGAWLVETAEETFRAAAYPDRLVVFRARPDGGGFTGLGYLAHEKAALVCDWATRAHVALAAVIGLERIGAADRLAAIVFDRRRTLRKSGAEAVGFHLALAGTADLALVVFPQCCAVVDPRTNERLAQIGHETLDAEAEALADRLAVLMD